MDFTKRTRIICRNEYEWNAVLRLLQVEGCGWRGGEPLFNEDGTPGIPYIEGTSEVIYVEQRLMSFSSLKNGFLSQDTYKSRDWRQVEARALPNHSHKLETPALPMI